MTNIIFRDPNITVFQSALFQTNSTVVKTDDCVLVVDPAWLPEEVMNIRRFVDSIRGQLPVFLVFTHSDFDHIIGYKAFEAEKIFLSANMAKLENKEEILAQCIEFDEKYYITRPYPIEFPVGDFLVYRDGVHYRHGQTRIAFYLAPGHTEDSMMVVVWQLGLCVAGDYLCDVEFPFIYHSSVEYEKSLEKLTFIHDKNWFTRLIPGHGSPALTINDWLHRRTEALAYIYALRESIATGIPFDEESLWARYKFPLLQRKYHLNNIELMTEEYKNGLWEWNPDLLAELTAPEERPFFMGPLDEEI